MADVVDKTKNPAKAQMPKKCPNCGLMNPFVRETCRKCKEPLPEPNEGMTRKICLTQLSSRPPIGAAKRFMRYLMG